MDSKQGALYTILVLGGIGLLAVSCSDDEADTHDAKMEHSASAEHQGDDIYFSGDEHEVEHDVSGEACVGFGPQTPRDIDSAAGENNRVFSLASSSSQMNLCNIHFHKNAEHKASAFNIYAGDGDGHGYESGYMCGISQELSDAELTPTRDAICKGEHGGLKPGDTIEVHWVHTSADVEPGPTLGSCLSDGVGNPELRVETQVFTLVNDLNALDFNELDYDGNMINGYHQPKMLPTHTGKPVVFAGSTTGPKYDEQKCSPLHVTWSVRPQCAKLDINSLGEWCMSNDFNEDHAHGVRKLVTNPELLSVIKH